MYDKTNIIIMSKLAVYDETMREKDLYKNQYFRHDYIYRQNMWTRFFVFLGSLILLGFYLMHMLAIQERDFLEMLISGEYKAEIFKVATFFVGLQVAYTILGTIIYTAAYEKAQKRIDNYYKLMSELNRRNESKFGKAGEKQKNDKNYDASKEGKKENKLDNYDDYDDFEYDDDLDAIPPPVNVLPSRATAKPRTAPTRPPVKRPVSGREKMLVYKNYNTTGKDRK